MRRSYQKTTEKTRVQIPVYTDRWMMGDRYGEIVAYSKPMNFIDPRDPRGRTIAKVKLDKSGRTLKFWLDDCQTV